MRKSIKTKFFFTFLVVLLVSELVLFLLSRMFLDDIVTKANEILIKNVYYDYKNIFEVENVDKNRIEKISSHNDLGIIVYDNGEILSCSSLFLCKNKNLPNYITKYLPYIKENEGRRIPGTLKILDVNQLFYVYNVGDGRYIIFDKALGSIEQINQILSPFFAIAGIFIFIFGSIIIFITSNKISRPIIRISEYANDLAHLKFDEKVNINQKDEIGQLAINMNMISEKLNLALNELNAKNMILKQDLEKERELDRQRVKYFSQVSHEFKTPLTIIQGYAEGIKHNVVNSKEDVDYYCNIIIDESKKMGHFVNDLLNLSMYESEHFQLNKSHFNLFDLIQTTTNKFHDTIKNKNVDLLIKGNTSCQIMADKNRMEQVINNFLSNALKFVKDEGEIILTIIEKKESVKITFYNNGEKINEEEMNHIWNLFYKLNHDKNYIGTGIGLAIIKSIIELHHGTYGVVNKSDGVEFYVEIPKN